MPTFTSDMRYPVIFRRFLFPWNSWRIPVDNEILPPLVGSVWTNLDGFRFEKSVKDKFDEDGESSAAFFLSPNNLAQVYFTTPHLQHVLMLRFG